MNPHPAPDHLPATAPAPTPMTAAVAGPGLETPVRYRTAIVILALYWAFVFAIREAELITFLRFMIGMASAALVVLAYSIWWLANRRISWTDRLGAVAVGLAGGLIAGLLADRSIGVFGMLFFVPPSVLTTSTLCLVATRRLSPVRQRTLWVTVVLCTWGLFTLLRMDGISGSQRPEYHWRWTPTAEELFLAAHAGTGKSERSAPDSGPAEGLPLTLQPGDWPAFRGADRDGLVRGESIASDWNTSPPRMLWKQRIGPAWSSVIIVNGKLFTQDQRGEFEAVVCLDAATGNEVWVHTDRARFWESVAGAGPRATPTFDGGRIYTQGATGIVNCLDAATGKPIWSRDLVKDSTAALPQWGFSSSPLVAEGLVVVFAGGPDDKGLLAYQADSGEPAWSVATGVHSYSSPVLESSHGRAQILFLSSDGVIAVEPASGKVQWCAGEPVPNAPISIQPQLLEGGQVLAPSPTDLGLALFAVPAASGGSTVADKLWGSRALQPSFNDLVVHSGFAYGFDEAIFGCLQLDSGKRRWKKGRFGHGQVLLLEDQGLLLVTAESGEVVLLSANPDKLDELGRFQAVEGKTWNHPAIAHGRLYVRNAEEIGSWDLKMH